MLFVLGFVIIHTHAHTHTGIVFSHKKNKFESVLVRWMNLEPLYFVK